MGTFQETGHGIIPRLCNTLFSKISSHHDDEGLAYKVEVSYMEIYNEKVHDLLDPKGYVCLHVNEWCVGKATLEILFVWHCRPTLSAGR